jgi:hypothetical protein
MSDFDPLAEKWRRFWRRPPDERSLIIRVMALLPLTEAGLRVMGFRRWKEIVERFLLSDLPQRTIESGQQQELAIKITRAVRSVELHGLSCPNCLERSMVLWWLLRQAGIPGELHIGARKSESQLEAHAWVELSGRVLNDSVDVHQHYSRFDAPIAASSGEPAFQRKSDAKSTRKAPS